MIIDKIGEGHYQTRSGQPVRIYALDGYDKYPVHGAILNEDGWKISIWKADGFWQPESIENDLDLIPVAQPLPESKKGYKIDLSEASEEERREAQELAFELGREWYIMGKTFYLGAQFIDNNHGMRCNNDSGGIIEHEAIAINLLDLRAAVAFQEQQKGKADDAGTFTFPTSDYTKTENEDGTITLTPIDKDYQANYEKALQFLDKTPENVMWPHSDLAKILVEFLNSVNHAD